MSYYLPRFRPQPGVRGVLVHALENVAAVERAGARLAGDPNDQGVGGVAAPLETDLVGVLARDVPRILKRMASSAELDLDLSGHSCRVGCAQDGGGGLLVPLSCGFSSRLGQWLITRQRWAMK